MESWMEMILEHMREKEGGIVPILACTLTTEQLHEQFYSGYGGENGKPFTLWTEARVYFPICYDGAEWVGSAPRNPCDEACAHQGGG